MEFDILNDLLNRSVSSLFSDVNKHILFLTEDDKPKNLNSEQNNYYSEDNVNEQTTQDKDKEIKLNMNNFENLIVNNTSKNENNIEINPSQNNYLSQNQKNSPKNSQQQQNKINRKSSQNSSSLINPLSIEEWRKVTGKQKLSEALKRLQLDERKIPPTNLNLLSLSQLTKEKARIKNELKRYDEEFIKIFKVKPVREDKEAMKPLYYYYQTLKNVISKKTSSNQNENNRPSSVNSNTNSRPNNINSNNNNHKQSNSNISSNKENNTEFYILQQKLNIGGNNSYGGYSKPIISNINGNNINSNVHKANTESLNQHHYGGNNTYQNISKNNNITAISNNSKAKNNMQYISNNINNPDSRYNLSSLTNNTYSLSTTGTYNQNTQNQQQIYNPISGTGVFHRKSQSGGSLNKQNSQGTFNQQLKLQKRRALSKEEIKALEMEYTGIKKEQNNLTLMLRKYQSEFQRTNNRKVKWLKDIKPVENEYKQYKNNKERIRQIKETIMENNSLNNLNSNLESNLNKDNFDL